jgi:DNA polymerase IV
VSAATVLHADLDAFFASVEQRDRPALKGHPVIVGGGVVLAASYEARRVGVGSGMGGREARRRCPNAIVVPARHEAYAEASDAVFEIFRSLTPLVEPLSVDEAFLDVAGARRLFGDPAAIARRLRERVKSEVGLPLSVGVASTKHLAKVASAQAKPDGLIVVEAGRELDFLHPLPVEVLWGVGPATAEKLHALGARTVRDLATMPAGLFGGGAVARHLRALAWNRDPRAIETGRRDHSIGSQRALGMRPRTLADAHEIILAIADRVASRLRKANRLARAVTITIRFHDFTRITRSHTFAEATDQSRVLGPAATELVQSVLAAPAETDDGRTVLEARGISLLAVRLSGLCRTDALQLVLPFHKNVAARELDAAIDAARDRFGAQAVTRLATARDRGGFVVLPRPTALDRPPDDDSPESGSAGRALAAPDH